MQRSAEPRPVRVAPSSGGTTPPAPSYDYLLALQVFAGDERIVGVRVIHVFGSDQAVVGKYCGRDWLFI